MKPPDNLKIRHTDLWQNMRIELQNFRIYNFTLKIFLTLSDLCLAIVKTDQFLALQIIPPPMHASTKKKGGNIVNDISS